MLQKFFAFESTAFSNVPKKDHEAHVGCRKICSSRFGGYKNGMGQLGRDRELPNVKALLANSLLAGQLRRDKLRPNLRATILR